MIKGKRIALHYQILIGLALGTGWALLSAHFGWSTFTANWIAPWGDIFISLLKLIAVPLVLFSIIEGITGLSDTESLGRIGLKTIAIYLITTVTAISIGLFLVNALKPGQRIAEDQRITNRISYELWVAQTPGVEKLDNLDYLNNPECRDKIDAATASLDELGSNNIVSNKVTEVSQKGEESPIQFLVDIVPGNIFSSLTDGKMLQIIFFAIFFGVVIVMLPREKVEVVVNFVSGANHIFIKMVDIIMMAAPYFVFALMAGKVSELAGDSVSSVVQIFLALGWYSVAVLVGLAFMIFVFYPAIVKLLTGRIGYSDFFKAISPAQFLAFSTSSSAATLPVTMECVSDNLGVQKEVSSFVLPIGATVNMDGTSLYQAIAVVFLAQFHMVELDFYQQLTIILTATLASIGSAAIPSAGLVMLIVVLQSVGLNPAWIAIIFPVDRFLDMCRTVVNVTGDASVSSIIAKTEGKLNFPPEEMSE